MLSFTGLQEEDVASPIKEEDDDDLAMDDTQAATDDKNA